VCVPPVDPTRLPPPRVRVADVDHALRRAGVAVLPAGSPRRTRGIRLGQMRDAVLVQCGGGPGDHTPTRQEVRTVLREAGFMVKDSAPLSALLYVIDRM
jgi:hypothetical protein